MKAIQNRPNWTSTAVATFRQILTQCSSSNNLILAGIIISCAILLMINITQPWVEFHAPAGVKRSIEAKNYIRYGFLNLKFGQCNNYEFVSDPKDLHFYQHHPPLTSILMVSSFLLFGINEFGARIIFVIFTLCNVFFVYTITKRGYGKRTALTSAFIFSVMPVTTFFGKIPNYEPITQFFLLLSVLTYMTWLDNRKNSKFYLFLAVYVVALFSDWPIYFLGALLPLHYMLSERVGPFRDKRILLIPVATIAIFGVFLAYIYAVDPHSTQSIMQQFQAHAGLALPTSQSEMNATIMFTPRLLFLKLVNRSLVLFLYPALILAAFGFLYLLVEIRRGKSIRYHMMILTLWLLPVVYCTIFYKSTFIHYFWIFYFGIPVAILAALGIENIFWKNVFNDNSYRRSSSITAVLFVVVLVFLPAVWHLRQLHSLQQKVLPGEQYESVTLIKNIGHQLRSVTNNNALILTNLTLRLAGLRGGPMLCYYAERKIEGNIENPSVIEQKLKTYPDDPGYFYLWLDKRETNPYFSDLEEYLKNNKIVEYKDMSVEGYKFRLFKLR